MNIEKFPARLPAIALRNQVLVFDDTLTHVTPWVYTPLTLLDTSH